MVSVSVSSRELTQAPFDPANALLRETTAELAAEVMDTPDGPRLVLTVRTDSVTVTVFLRKGNALDWAGKITEEAGKMGGQSLSEVLREG